MPRWSLRHWYLASAAAALLTIAFALVMRADMPATRTLMLLNLAVFNAQLVEKFGWPGGFAGLQHSSIVPDGWHRLSCPDPARDIWTSCWFALFVFLPPVLFPDQIWMVMSSIAFGWITAVCHATILSDRPGLHYTPGLATALLGFVPVGLAFLCHAYDIGIPISLVDWGLGLLIPLADGAVVLGISLALARRAGGRHRSPAALMARHLRRTPAAH